MKAGFVIAFNGFHKWPLLFTVHPDPARPKAWNTLAVRDRLKDIAHRLNCMVVVGQAELATHVYGPAGRVYKRTTHPQFFLDDGRRIGVPEGDFRPFPPSPREIVEVLFGPTTGRRI